MESTKKKQCLLKSVNQTHPHIEIALDADTFIGRTRETQVQDTCVSKKHLKVRVDSDNRCIILELLGMNPSTLNGVQIEKSKEYKAYNGDVIELIPSQYPYKVIAEFERPNSKKSPEPIEKKRKRSVDDPGDFPSFKRMKWKIDIYLDTQPRQSHGSSWQSYNKGQLVVYTPAGCKSSTKIAAYDMDGTFIATQSGKVFPTSIDDWKLAFGSIVPTLKAKHAEGYKIVIFTNQMGVSSGKTKLPDIKKKIENVIGALSVPVQAFVATGDNCFRKPLIGMWQALCDHKNDGVSIDMNQSYYVGDAAGRPENKAIKKKKDHSSADRLMALNLSLPFYTPEEHFMKVGKQNWIKPEFNPKEYLSNSIELVNNPRTKITSTDLELIIMVGGPGTGITLHNSFLTLSSFISFIICMHFAGKSQFCKEHLENSNYEIVSRDVIGTWQKCVDRVNDCLKMRRRVVVDNTNGDRQSRERYINAAKKHMVPCRCFVMSTSFKHAEHNIAFRELTDTKHSKISKIVINSYRKNFEEPSMNEGYTEIVRINFVPHFSDERERSLYELYLLSS